MASAQILETSVANNSPSQNSNHPDDLFQSRYVTPGFKPFSYYAFCLQTRMLMKQNVNNDVSKDSFIFSLIGSFVSSLRDDIFTCAGFCAILDTSI